MARSQAPTIPPWLKRASAVPCGLYEHGAGWVLGRRVVQLTHEGRKSGRTLHPVLEVVRYDRATDETTVLAAFGPMADWLRNIQAAARTQVDLGHGPRPASFRMVPVEEAIEVVADYERRNVVMRPVLRRALTSLLGWPIEGSRRLDGASLSGYL